VTALNRENQIGQMISHEKAQNSFMCLLWTDRSSFVAAYARDHR
jgi:hypothetical protein